MLLRYSLSKKEVPLKAYIILPSKHSVKETIDRLVISLQRSDMIIYARINRQIEARWYGKTTQPMEFILFDDPRLSACMVKRNPVIALCFPMRIIAWEDEIGRCRVAYKDPLHIMKEFRVASVDYQWPDLQPEITRALEE